MIDNIKLLLGIQDSSKDELLTLLVNACIDEVIAYTHNEKCIGELDSTIQNMVVYNYNRLGTEGVTSEGYSGVTYNYSTDYPDSIMRVLKAHRKLRVL